MLVSSFVSDYASVAQSRIRQQVHYVLRKDSLLDPLYIEAILVWSKGQSQEQVQQWLRSKGFNVTEMVSGLLITGTLNTFEKTFAVKINIENAPIQLSIPRELQGSVSSITIPKTRKINS